MRILTKIAQMQKEARLWPTSRVSGDTGGEWADQFKNTPLYVQALDLQREEAQRDAERAREEASNSMRYAQDAMFRVRVRELEAQLAELQVQSVQGPPQMGMEMGGDPGMMLPPEPQSMAAPPGVPSVSEGAAPNAMPPGPPQARPPMPPPASQQMPMQPKMGSALMRAIHKVAAGAADGDDEIEGNKARLPAKATPKRADSVVPGTQQMGTPDTKTASVGEFLELSRLLEAGQYGFEATEAFRAISGTKVASYVMPAENDNIQVDSSRLRLAEFLRKSAPTGLEAGSAYPNPPRDNS